MYKMQNVYEYLWEITGLQRNFMLGSGSNRLYPELPKDSYFLFSAAKLEKSEKPLIMVSDFKHHQTSYNCVRCNFKLFVYNFSLEMSPMTVYWLSIQTQQEATLSYFTAHVWNS